MDRIADAAGQSHREWPDLDSASMSFAGLLREAAARLAAELRPVSEAAGLGEGECDVLVALRRTGKPYQLTPGELRVMTQVTSGAVTKRVDRLQDAGLVTRAVDTDDARVRPVTLTRKGLHVVDRFLEAHFAHEQRLVAGLSAAEAAALTELLQKWTNSMGRAE